MRHFISPIDTRLPVEGLSETELDYCALQLEKMSTLRSLGAQRKQQQTK